MREIYLKILWFFENLAQNRLLYALFGVVFTIILLTINNPVLDDFCILIVAGVSAIKEFILDKYLGFGKSDWMGFAWVLISSVLAFALLAGRLGIM